MPDGRSQRWLERARQRRLALFTGLFAGAVGLFAGISIGSNGEPPPAQPASPAAVVQQAADPTAERYLNDQQAAEIQLLREALADAREVDAHHRHHSKVMWDLLMGKISSREAWWQGGDSTCAGWLAAGRFEVALARLQGREASPPPIPKQGLEFCKQARERR